MRLRIAMPFFAVLCTSASAQEINEQFNTESLDWHYWCPCQIDMDNAPVTFPEDPEMAGNRFARIPVDDFSLGGNRCRSGAPKFECTQQKGVLAEALLAAEEAEPASVPDLPERLGPSFFAAPESPAALVEAAPRDPYCDDDIELRAHRKREDDECIQRQELRLRKFKPLSGEAYEYSFRFRMPEDIEDRMHSIRWVIAQWKEQPLSKAYTDTFGTDWGPSPFLALRFDDGVLHVTVQDEDCRCLVARAPHPHMPFDVWSEDNPDGCKSAAAGPGEGDRCTPAFTVDYGGKDPVLPTALGSWVEMRFRVQASRSEATIEVEADGQHIVTVKGKIGYEYSEDPDSPTKTKFKIGHYRDYMPFPHTMDIDWLTVDKAD